MKKSVLKIIAAILVLAIALPLCLTGAAAGAARSSGYNEYNSALLNHELLAKADGEQCPTIIIPGIAMSYMYLADENNEPVVGNNGAEKGDKLVIVDSDALVGTLLGTLLGPLAISTVLGKPMGLREATAKTVGGLLGIQSMNKDGTLKNNVLTEYYPGPLSSMSPERREEFYAEAPVKDFAEYIGEDNIYFFAFSLFADPMDTGIALHEYIQLVKEQQQVSKVNLLTLSLGGSILTAYLDLTEEECPGVNPARDVNRIVNGVSMLNGTEVFTDLFSKRFNTENNYIYDGFLAGILNLALKNDILEKILLWVIKLIPEKVFLELLKGAYDGVMETLLLNNPQFWTMIKGDEYEAVADRYLVGEEYAALRKKTDRFAVARKNLAGHLTDLEAAEITTYNLCAYDLRYDEGKYSFFGIVRSAKGTNSDGIIHLGSTSFGAVYAPADQSLGSDYIDAMSEADKKYLSPNGTVDASKCLFPDTTWFVSNQLHDASGNDYAMGMLLYIIMGCLPDIDSCPDKFPQFNLGRETRELTRTYIPQAEDVLNNRERYRRARPAQFDALEAALDDALAMLAVTNAYNAPDAENVIDALVKALKPFS
ncbi:MAG: hypothetical protein FWF05_01820 [Oscillospiraceae bacterium]|nr:hypothetical protein [Oscillospiraceae bacterium]